MANVSRTKVLQALKNMGYVEKDKGDDIVALVRQDNPDDPYPVIVDISRSSIPLDDLRDHLELCGVDWGAFLQILETL